jgi:hypothetical protein
MKDRPSESITTDRRGFLRVLGLGGLALLAHLARGGFAQTAKKAEAMNPRLYTFIGGATGDWKITGIREIIGEGLPKADKLSVLHGQNTSVENAGAWALHGVTSNERYVTRPEKQQLVAKQEGLGRPQANCAALIPIRKSAKWWELTQDERRAIFENQSHHTATGLKYLPQIARRLHHCRDLQTTEPFDFLTWFEFAEHDAKLFDQLLLELRQTEEWKYVEREVEIRLIKAST